MEALVIRSTGSFYQVMTPEGKFFECRIKGSLRLKGIRSTNPVAVGDRVLFRLERENTGVIYEVLDRKNYIIRRSVNLSRQTQIIAANIDMAFLMVTVDFPQTTTGFIDRFLVSAEAYHIPVTILFNKIDLYDEARLALKDSYREIYSRIGYRCCDISVKTGQNIDLLKGWMKGKVSVISGHSGVGKSSLINSLEPSIGQKTGEISTAHLSGRHTTTFAEMFPLSFGGYIIDTPGIRGFGLVDMSREEVGDYFPEIFALKSQCRFNNCLHVNEPGCAVRQAVEQGRISPSRYASYLSFLEEEDTYRGGAKP